MKLNNVLARFLPELSKNSSKVYLKWNETEEERHARNRGNPQQNVEQCKNGEQFDGRYPKIVKEKESLWNEK